MERLEKLVRINALLIQRDIMDRRMELLTVRMHDAEDTGNKHQMIAEWRRLNKACDIASTAIETYWLFACSTGDPN